MTYLTVAQMAENGVLGKRVLACAALEDVENPELFVSEKRFNFAGQPGWEAAWDYAKALQPGAGADAIAARPELITDGMILAAVQALRP